jgi:hypothetical protein
MKQSRSQYQREAINASKRDKKRMQQSASFHLHAINVQVSGPPTPIPANGSDAQAVPTLTPESDDQ